MDRCSKGTAAEGPVVAQGRAGKALSRGEVTFGVSLEIRLAECYEREYASRGGRGTHRVMRKSLGALGAAQKSPE